MSCYKPLRAIHFINNVNVDTGKKIIRIIPDSKWLELRSSNPDQYEFLSIPCGKCLGCRLDYSREWANRMLLEASMHSHNYFLTLTYNDTFLPKPLEGSPIHPLVKDDLRGFIKRFRRRLEYHYPNENHKVRFYACGEYGPENMRPHYHLILFMDMRLPLEYLKRSPQGDIYYRCADVDLCWQYVPKSDDDTMASLKGLSLGYHAIAPANWTSMAYTARYVTKKLTGELSSKYDELNYPREFSLCSRKPGIARAYYDENKETIYSDCEIIVPTPDGAKKFMPPRYFDRICMEDNPTLMQKIKDERFERAIFNTEQKLNLTSLDYLDMLDSELQNLEARTKILRRNKV